MDFPKLDGRFVFYYSEKEPLYNGGKYILPVTIMDNNEKWKYNNRSSHEYKIPIAAFLVGGSRWHLFSWNGYHLFMVRFSPFSFP